MVYFFHFSLYFNPNLDDPTGYVQSFSPTSKLQIIKKSSDSNNPDKIFQLRYRNFKGKYDSCETYV